uniref:tRNA(Ile2) 2-agmatinylcytidine synthetase TiaS n=1 Tax=Candidatus Methanomethylicus mesodigestus TaxID=1867258 RepID=A0A7C3EX43_9CREN
MHLYHLALDDTDSLKMGCTTYVGAMILKELIKSAKFVDYPNLIRLNPNIPWKSRGNAAVCLRFQSNLRASDILDLAIGMTNRFRDQYDEKNQPGIALHEGEVPEELKRFGRRALYEVIDLGDAMRIADSYNIKYHMIKGGRGLIGAIAAIGNTLEEDHTFEIIAYRGIDKQNVARDVNYDSVAEMSKRTHPMTFNNIDVDSKRLLITPHGPDPILFGIRGEDPETLVRALKMVKFSGAEFWVIYRSNQGTDAHVSLSMKIKDLKPYYAATIEGRVASNPFTIAGGHVIFNLSDGESSIDVAAYEPSGGLRKVISALIPGDQILVAGGVRLDEEQGNRMTFNLEKLQILKLIYERRRNPICTSCHKRMKSEGKNKGYQCKKCGLKLASPEREVLNRNCSEGIYLPPPRSMRHLAKPLQRHRLEKESWNRKVGTITENVRSPSLP